MKKFNVECVDVTPEMIAGNEPWSNESIGFVPYEEANTETEAIETVMWQLVKCSPKDVKTTIENDMVIYRKGGSIIGGHAFFTATEIK